MTKRQKFTKHCPDCGSQDIFQSSYWTWNIDKQDWEVADDDLIRCNDCDYGGFKVATEPYVEESEEKDQ